MGAGSPLPAYPTEAEAWYHYYAGDDSNCKFLYDVDIAYPGNEQKPMRIKGDDKNQASILYWSPDDDVVIITYSPSSLPGLFWRTYIEPLLTPMPARSGNPVPIPDFPMLINVP